MERAWAASLSSICTHIHTFIHTSCCGWMNKWLNEWEVGHMNALPQFEVNGILMQMNIKVCSHDNNLDVDEEAPLGLGFFLHRVVWLSTDVPQQCTHSPCLCVWCADRAFFTFRCHAGWLPVTQVLMFLKKCFEVWWCLTVFDSL